jgi:hypothetical protein
MYRPLLGDHISADPVPLDLRRILRKQRPVLLLKQQKMLLWCCYISNPQDAELLYWHRTTGRGTVAP